MIFAYLFGGLAKGGPNPLSDVDIAVYVGVKKTLDYLELFSGITRVLGTDEVDLVVLNDAPLSLAGRILQNRRLLVDKAPYLRHEYESLALREFFDFAVKEREILKRRYALVDKLLVGKKLAQMDEYLSQIEEYARISIPAYEK